MPQPDYFPPLPPNNDLNFDKLLQWLAQQTISAQKLITGSLQAGQEIGSANFVPGSAGWQIDGDGNAEFNDVTVRGDIESGNWNGASPANLSSVDGTATAGFYLDSSVGSAQFEGDIFVGGNIRLEGDIMIDTDFATAGKFILKNSNSDIRMETQSITFAGFSWIDTSISTEVADMYATGSPSSLIFRNKESDASLSITTLDDAVQISGGLQVSGGFIRGVPATVSTPTYSFSGDTDTGMFSPGGNQLGFATAGAERLRLSGWKTQIRGPNGRTSLTDATNYGYLAQANGMNTSSRYTPGYWFGSRDPDLSGELVLAGVVGRATATYSTSGSGGMDVEIVSSAPGSQTLVSIAMFRGGTGLHFNNDTDTYLGPGAGNQIKAVAGGSLIWLLGTSGLHLNFTHDLGDTSGLFIGEHFKDIGNHETLRADRTVGGTGTTEVGFYSSWEFEPGSGRRAKRNITSLDRSPKWNREWFDAIRPVTFIRTSTKQREFGFRIEDWAETHDNMKYLTTKGDQWGYAPHETALLAVTILEVQDLRKRVAALEAA